jgi:tetratricopeptide (TPR) repeat protein
MKYEEAIVYIEEGILLEMNRGKPDNVATFLCELGKIAYLQKNFQQAKLLCEQALSIKVTIFPRVVKSGLAIYTKFLNNEVESELYLLALISLESNALDSCEKLLDLLRANSERKFYARMLGKAFDMLSIVAFQKGDYRKSITLLVNSLKTKYETGDYAGIIVSSAILQLYFLNEELGIYASFLQQKLDALRI